MSEEPIEYFRKDYRESDYLITHTNLEFALQADLTQVTVNYQVKYNVNVNTLVNAIYPDLVLHGEDIQLVSVKVKDQTLEQNAYEVSKTLLTIRGEFLCDSFDLKIVVTNEPSKNSALSGLYQSGSILCTQCEAMGFRRITYSLDRPDILSIYQVKLIANKTLYPVLLSNGNMVEKGDINDENHFAVWNDPFPKPSYLFALVAGDLGSIHSTYQTISGRIVQLGIYSDKENVSKLDHAMYSLKKSMEWDEKTFGLECDLDIYNIVATNDFNMGAMENKGLNIFNSAYVLADPKTATDTDYENILGVIGHEYFHNWTGNRVTVRDWFQLTLKEGLTVFRDQWFSSDQLSYSIKRIEDIRFLRSKQFLEDSGPMAHPIRPESYISMDNFYTLTVYEKGSEVIKLYKTLLGEEGFKLGLKEYFRRYDGKAVTCSDFLDSMAFANNVDLSIMERWYSQAGTPIVTCNSSYDASTKTLSLTFHQKIPSTPYQDESSKLPQLIPIQFGCISKESKKEILSTQLIKFDQYESTYVFTNIIEEPIISLFRDFSAPIKLIYTTQTNEDLALLMTYDTDEFNRWDACHRLCKHLILEIMNTNNFQLPEYFINNMKQILLNTIQIFKDTDGIDTDGMKSKERMDFSLIAYFFQLPDLVTLSSDIDIINIENLSKARKFVINELANKLQDLFIEIYELTKTNEYRFHKDDISLRRLKNTCLCYIACLNDEEAIKRCKYQFDTANCMTDKIAALSLLVSKRDSKACQEALEQFHRDANGDALVLNKWFAIQANASDCDNLIDYIKELRKHPDFILSNPNRARSILSTFANNLVPFHHSSGNGYEFIANAIIEVDKLNPQVAARLTNSFAQWKRFDVKRQEMMKSHLERIKNTSDVSKDTFEVATRCLK